MTTRPTIPGYRLLRFLGGGPLFQVWEGRAVDDVIPVAVKFCRSEAVDNPTARALLLREARAGVAVRHPRLARVVRSHLAEPPHFLVCELVPGESLRDLLRRLGRLDLRSAAWAARQTAEALAALHRAGFVHADVKPGNVLLSTMGEAKLADFGFTHQPGENRELLKPGSVLGTANYLAPELCRRPIREGPPADIFALGVTVFECLTGQLPFPSGSVAEVIRDRRTATPTSLADLPGEWPGRLVKLVAAMLAVDPEDRPDAARVVRELVRVEVDCLRAA